MSPKDKPLVWLHGEVKTPPFGRESRLEMGYLLRRLQRGDSIALPHGRPMPSVGRRCHELRLNDGGLAWRVIYRIDRDAIIIAEVFGKKSQKTPQAVLETCRRRLREYDDACK